MDVAVMDLSLTKSNVFYLTVNAADNKMNDKKMTRIEIDIDPYVSFENTHLHNYFYKPPPPPKKKKKKKKKRKKKKKV